MAKQNKEEEEKEVVKVYELVGQVNKQSGTLLRNLDTKSLGEVISDLLALEEKLKETLTNTSSLIKKFRIQFNK